MRGFDVYEAQNALDFINHLRLSDDKLWANTGNGDDSWSRSWIFRGESSIRGGNQWSALLPSAWRQDVKSKDKPFGKLLQRVTENPEYQSILDDLLGNVPDKNLWTSQGLNVDSITYLNNRRQLICDAFAELKMIHEFIRLADELGFVVGRLPSWTNNFEDFVQGYQFLHDPTIKQVVSMSQFSPESPPNQLRRDLIALWTNPAIALARHHGIPTRLLDWTRDSLTAAFFAAVGVKKLKPNDYIAVYAVSETYFSDFFGDVQLVEAPASDNDFLRAQLGVFTVDISAHYVYVTEGQYFNVGKALLRASGIDKPLPRKIILRVSEAKEVLRLLWVEHVTAGHLMPTLDHVAEAVLTKMQFS